MSIAKGGYLEKLPSSVVKWQNSGWKKRWIQIKSRGGQAPRSTDNSRDLATEGMAAHARFHCAQGNMAHPDFISWADKEGKSNSGMLEITPGSTLTINDVETGATRDLVLRCHNVARITARRLYRHDDPHLRRRSALVPCAQGDAQRRGSAQGAAPECCCVRRATACCSLI